MLFKRRYNIRTLDTRKTLLDKGKLYTHFLFFEISPLNPKCLTKKQKHVYSTECTVNG